MALHFITSPEQTISPQSPIALVTLIVGESYQSSWQKVAMQSWQRYAQRHGYDIIAITCPLDYGPHAAKRSVAWQKCLILSQSWSGAYQRIVWVDADIVISPSAPAICAGVPVHQVGAVFNYAQHSLAEAHIRLERTPERARQPIDFAALAQDYGKVAKAWDDYHRHIYRDMEQLDTPATRTLQTGVLVLSPEHRPLLEQAYVQPQHTRCYEQHPLSALLIDGNWLHELNPRFNWVFFEACALYYPPLLNTGEDIDWKLFDVAFKVQLLNNAWFLHFAGMEQLFGRLQGIQIG